MQNADSANMINLSERITKLLTESTTPSERAALLQAMATLHVARQTERLADMAWLNNVKTVGNKPYKYEGPLAGEKNKTDKQLHEARCVQHVACDLPAGHEKCKSCGKGIGGVCGACHCLMNRIRHDTPEGTLVEYGDCGEERSS